MKKCSICGKEYTENPMLSVLPNSLKERLKYIPDCECEYELMKKEKDEETKKQILENEFHSQHINRED